VLSEQVETVRLTRRLTDSAACLVVDKDDMTLALRRLLESSGQKVPPRKPILEINPGHALIDVARAESDPSRFEDWVRLLYDQALLSEGGQLDDPVRFVRRLNGLLLGPSGTLRANT
jgi:molecular chaperone HtpG